MEGELFGYARGAFSGAVRAYDGLVSAAQGGTVFLDEIDDTPHPLQVKLLRVLEDRVVNRLGENEWRKVDFRILAATNRDLRKLVEQGVFGADLYERLAVIAIQLPPLRERIEDLPALLEHLIDALLPRRGGRDSGACAKRSPEALRALEALSVAGQHPRAAQRGLLGARRQARRRRASALGPSSACSSARSADRDAVRSSTAPRWRSRWTRAPSTCAARPRHSSAPPSRPRSPALSGNVSRAAKLLGEVGRGAPSDPGATLRAMMKRLGIGRRTAH